ncbi:MAG: ATP-binding domain-containing protein, partial [Thermoguttaceae bacterium]|nr:ATP-binding domain-containing protein [Thermoguttaceae bacterium]
LNFEKALRLHGVPFRILHGTEFFDRTEIRDLLAYFRLLANPHDDEAFQRVVNVPARGIGKTSLDHLRRFAWENGFSLWEAAQHVNECETLKNRAKQAIQAFCELILNLYFEASGKLLTLAQRIVELSGYAAQFDASDELDAQRLRNVEEFLSMAGRFDETAPVPTLGAFLEQNALVSDADDVQFAAPKDVFDENPAEDEKPARNSVALMTLHAAKGLEFPVVYLTACEHGILPHERAFEDPNELEEERRLMFVGMTRAKEELNLSMAESRENAGRRSVAAPSPFLMELPREEMQMENFQATLSFDSFEFRPRRGKRSERLDESFGESPEEAVFEPKSFPTADESEAWLDEGADFAEPADYMPRDSRPNSPPKKPKKPAAKPVQSDAPILKKLPSIPGLMTGADLLRQKEEDF